MRMNKMMCFDTDVYEYLQKQTNASDYVSSLVRFEIAKEQNKKNLNIIDIGKEHNNLIQEIELKENIDIDRKARNQAWGLLDLEVQEEIKDIPDWGQKWKDIFYKMYNDNGKNLTVKDVREWYFANKEGFKL